VFIVFAAIIFFIVRTDLFTGQKGGKTMIEVNTSAIQQAKDVKARLEQNGVYSSEEVQ
jgi:3-hydroxyisobutyrate dehydrogenase-like beta-hydroxyacid dehydrogenase